jgi:putative membrane protein insertion efficiency factor
MPALRQPVRRRRVWLISIAAAVLAAAAMADWTRPPDHQLSVRLYEQAVIKPYRALVRPGVSRFIHCRFAPTCSEYSVQAFRAHGFPKGAWLTVKRLCRCMPWVPFGTFDPVPPPHSP